MNGKEYIVEDLKIRLDKFLVSQAKGFSRGQLQRAIEAGLVHVNGKLQTETDFVVRCGDRVTMGPIKDEKIIAKNIPLVTLYNDHGLLIIDKPPGLSVHPGSGVKGDSLTQALLYHFKDIHLVGEEHRPGIVHRLDKDTSGVMLVALTPEMYEYLKDAFVERRVKKHYLALVSGRLAQTHGFWNSALGKSKTDFRKVTSKNPKEAKEALTEYSVLEGLDTWSFLKLKLHTGRTHQIRVHASESGHPLAGDNLYGGKKISGLNRQFLHAWRIEVQLPDGTWIEAESKLPDDLRTVLEKLGSKKVSEL